MVEPELNKLLKESSIDIVIDSAATGDWHVGEAPCENSITVAKNNGIDISSQRSRQITKKDLYEFDLVVAFDDSNFNVALLKSVGEELLHFKCIPVTKKN